MAPFGKQWPIGRTPSDISADGHGAERAPMIALPPGKNSVSCRLPFFNMVLPDKLDGRFRCFGPARCEVDTAAILKIWRSHREKPSGKSLRRRRMKLRGVRESELRGLLSHRSADFGNTVPDIDDGSLACRIEEFAAIGRKEPAAFTPDGNRKILVKIARKEGGVV